MLRRRLLSPTLAKPRHKRPYQQEHKKHQAAQAEYRRRCAEAVHDVLGQQNRSLDLTDQEKQERDRRKAGRHNLYLAAVRGHDPSLLSNAAGTYRAFQKLDMTVKEQTLNQIAASGLERLPIEIAIEAERSALWQEFGGAYSSLSRRGRSIVKLLPQLLIGDAGAGKSQQAVFFLSLLGRCLTTWFMVPTLAKAIEQMDEYNAMRSPLDPEGKYWPGLLAKDPATEQPLCQRTSVVQEYIERGGRSIERSLCHDPDSDERCPHFEACPVQRYRAEVEQAAASEAGVVVFTAHNALVTSSRLSKPDLLVIDEDPLAVVRDKRSATLMALKVFNPRPKPHETIDARGDRAAIVRAVMEYVVQAAIRKAQDQQALSPLNMNYLRETGLTAQAVNQSIEAMRGEEPPDILGATPKTVENVLAKLRLDEQAETGPLSTQRSLLEALAVELDTEKPFSDRVRVQGESGNLAAYVEIQGARDLILSETADSGARIDPTGILILDASGNPERLRLVFGEFDVADCRGPLHMLTAEVTVKSFSTINLTTHPGAQNLREDVAQVIEAFGGLTKSFLATTKGAVNQAEFTPIKMRGHFGSLRGLNKFQDAELCAVVGREEPGPLLLEGFAAALHQAVDIDSIAHLTKKELQATDGRGYQKQFLHRDGGSASAVHFHPDPRVDAELRQIRDGNMLQAAARVRGVHNMRRLIIFGDQTAPDLPMHIRVDWKRLKREAKFGAACRRVGGFLTLSAGGLSTDLEGPEANGIAVRHLFSDGRKIKERDLDPFWADACSGPGNSVLESYTEMPGPESAEPLGLKQEMIEQIKSFRRTFLRIFAGFGLALWKRPGGAALVLLAPDVDTELARGRQRIGDQSFIVLYPPEPIPKMLSELDAEIKQQDLAAREADPEMSARLDGLEAVRLKTVPIEQREEALSGYLSLNRFS